MKKDILLFRYENPRKVTFQNLMAATCLCMWTWCGYFSWSLRARFAPYKETIEASDKAWMLKNIELGSRGIGVAFFMFGVGLCVYWLIRNTHTVRRLILRKGGKNVTFVTYGLTGVSSRHITVPLYHVI